MKKQGKAAKKKRTILAVSAVGVLVLIGGAIAYNSTTHIFNNLFHLGATGPEEFTEDFTPTEKWACQEELPKSVWYKNTSGYTRAVRVKYEDYWKRKDSTSTDHQTELPKEKDGKSLTKINFQNESDWILESDGWYYYRFDVADGEQTSEFMESVTFDCDFEETETVTCTDTATGKECSSNESDYMQAKYHVFITIQATTEPDTDGWSYTPVPLRKTLYDTIAEQTQGVDTGVNFSRFASEGQPDHNGVNTLAAHKDDAFPVYYYRGDVDNNWVVFEGKCWKIIRTAESGATKILYSGEYADGACSDDTDTYVTSQTVASYSPASSNINYPGSDAWSMAQAGWMYGKNDYHSSNSGTGSMTSHKYAKDVRWDGTYYNLVDYVDGSEFDNSDMRFYDNYSYYCAKLQYYNPATGSHLGPTYDDATDTRCKDVLYHISTQNMTVVLRLSGGEKIEDAIRKMKENTNNSNAKTIVDNWFNTNIVNNRDKLADVSFCNERHTSYGGLKSDNPNEWTLFNGWVRVSGLANNGVAQPSIDCTDADDKFTVSKMKGNGALTYPVGIMSADEYELGGVCFNGGYPGIHTYSYDTSATCDKPSSDADVATNYLFSKKNVMTMTPMDMSATGGPYMIYVYWNTMNAVAPANGYYRPVIALKYRTYIQSGEGSRTDPYILEWDN